MNYYRVLVFLAIAAFAPRLAVAVTIDFEEKALSPESYWNGSDDSGGFTSNGAFFNNTFTDWGGGMTSWANWSYSNMTDTTTAGYGNQYSAFSGSGFDGSDHYAIAYEDGYLGETPYINLPNGHSPVSICVTNTTYTALAMQDGYYVAKKFGGSTGDDADWYTVTLTGYSDLAASGEITGSSLVYLADYRFADNSQDYIVDTWKYVDLTPLGNAKSIGIRLDSSDFGTGGINTPTYAAFDNFITTPEPSFITLILTGLVTIIVWGRRNGAFDRHSS